MLLSQFEVARDWIGERRPRPSYWLMMARQENEKTRCLGSIKKIANKYRNVDMFYPFVGVVYPLFYANLHEYKLIQ